METSPAAAPGVPRLRRTLTLWDLIFYGIVLIQPIAPVPLYGVAQKLSDGHFVTIILIALFAMLITAVSYGRMGALYPTAGSAYTYVGRGLNPHLGFLLLKRVVSQPARLCALVDDLREGKCRSLCPRFEFSLLTTTRLSVV
jgi:amino acid transporter